MLGLSSSCDATVRLTRKASIPEKPGDVKEFDKGKRWNADLPGGKSDDTMFLPVGKSDAPCGAMCAFGTLRFICHYEALSFHSVQRTLSLRSTALRCCGNLPEGNPFHKTHARYFCTCVEKKGANKHKSEHYRSRQCDFKSAVIGDPAGYVYPWGKGAHKQKSEHYRLQ